MKLLIILGLVLLAGCAETQTLEQLELAAIQSGDWSAVDRRERSLARRGALGQNRCPAHTVQLCEVNAGRSNCTCASNDAMRRMFNDR